MDAIYSANVRLYVAITHTCVERRRCLEAGHRCVEEGVNTDHLGGALGVHPEWSAIEASDDRGQLPAHFKRLAAAIAQRLGDTPRVRATSVPSSHNKADA